MARCDTNRSDRGNPGGTIAHQDWSISPSRRNDSAPGVSACHGGMIVLQDWSISPSRRNDSAPRVSACRGGTIVLQEYQPVTEER